MASSHSTSTYESSDDEVEVVRDSEEEEEEYVPEEEKKTKKKITVWSEKDEITILEGLIKLQKLCSSSGKKSNINQFYSLINDSLVADVSREQLSEKVKRLKRKFMQNKKNTLADPNLSINYDSHSKRVFELSKQIWDECVAEPESEERRKKKKEMVVVNNKINDSADDDENKKKKKKKKKKRKIINERESESQISNAFTKIFHEYCEEKGFEVKWLEKEERDSLGNLWKQASQLEWEHGILESKYKRLRYDLDETIYSLLKRYYIKSPALFTTHDN